MKDQLTLEVADIVANVFTGIYSEETGQAQPLRISICASLDPQPFYTQETSLSDSFDYMRLKRAATLEIESAGHFQLIEAVADHICKSLFASSSRINSVNIKIVKLAISENGEEIGLNITRGRF